MKTKKKPATKVPKKPARAPERTKTAQKPARASKSAEAPKKPAAILVEKACVEAIFDKWTRDTSVVREQKLSTPIFALLGEAAELAANFDAYWEVSTQRDGDGGRIPGFEDVAEGGLLDEHTGREIFELLVAVARAQARVSSLADVSTVHPMQRAEFVLGELRSALAFAFDDEQTDDADKKLQRLNEEFREARSHDAKALALEAYVVLAEQYQRRLASLGSFDTTLFDEARAIAGALRLRSTQPLLGETGSPLHEALATRNRLLALLLQRVQRIRRAARYVFRAHPHILERFRSAYERNRRQLRTRGKRPERNQTEPE